MLEQDVAWVKHPLLVPWVIGSIPHGGPIELFLIPWYVLSMLWDGAYERALAANQKE